MNKTKIEWADYTWSPVTGCLHGCKYCYARRIAERFEGFECRCGGEEITEESREYGKNSIWNTTYGKSLHVFKEQPMKIIKSGKFQKASYPYGFSPTFHKYRLDEPQKVTKPSKVFVCSMADLFGDWVPDYWIVEVFKACEAAPQHTYLFLTKNPKRYGQSNLYQLFQKKNIWLGTTITGANDSVMAKWLLATTLQEANTFISIEPLLGHIGVNIAEIYPHNQIKWIIVGAQTGSGVKPPKPEWVQGIIDEARYYEIPVFLKNNLKWPEKIQEYPEGMRT